VGLTAFNLRQYDARLGRWQTPDPYGQHHSPYLAMSNNPVSFTDPDGGYDGYWVDGIRVFGIDMTDLLDRYGRSGQAFDLAIYTTDANGRLTYGDELYNVIMDNGNLRSAEYSYAEMLNVTEALYQQPDGSIVSVSATVFRNPHTGGVWAEANGVVAMCRKEYGTLADRLDMLHQLAAERDAQHLAADIAGFVPGLGEPADILNIGLYIRDGDYNSAGWSTLAAIPALGVLATLYKWSKRADNAVGAAKSSTTTLYRAVKPDELEDINKLDMFVNRGEAEGKYFTTSAEHAADYARKAVQRFGDPPYTIVRTQVPTSSLPFPVPVDGGIPAYVIPNNLLPDLKPTVLNHMPLPPR